MHLGHIRIMEANSLAKVDLDAVRNTVAIYSPNIKQAMLEEVKSELNHQWRRMMALNTRATGLIGAVPLTLTLGSFLLGFASRGYKFSIWVVIFAVVGASAAVLSGVIATRALAIDDYNRPSWETLFNSREVEAANGWSLEDDTRALGEYHQWLVPHYWLVATENERLNNAKADRVSAAQWAFAGFLFFFALSLIVLFSTFK